MDEEALARVEQLRTELEAQISKLRKSLQYWQTLEIDYEGLKEEFVLLPETCSREDFVQAATDFGPEIVDEKELYSLVGTAAGAARTPRQVIDLLSKRINYVTKNSDTIKKQLSDAEKKRNALLLAEEPEYRDDAGLPLTEVTEELDGNGNVISSKVEASEAAAPQLLSALKKAGVRDIVQHDGIVTAKASSEAATGSVVNAQNVLEKLAHNTTPIPTKEPEDSSILAGNTPDAVPGTKTLLPGAKSEQDLLNDKPPTTLTPAHEKPIFAPDDKIVSFNPEDTEDDAALRREMLEYGLNDVGAIVAELDMEEDASDVSYVDEGDDVDTQLDSEVDELDEEDDSEDEYGRSKHAGISGTYRRKMEQLEKKLGMQSMQNLGPEPNLPAGVEIDRPTAAEAARRAAIARAEAAKVSKYHDGSDNKASKAKAKKSSKKVAFADKLDIATETELKPVEVPSEKKGSPVFTSEPVQPVVVERSSTTHDEPAVTVPKTAPKRVSRFKTDRASTDLTTDPSTTPQRSENQIMSTAILERLTTRHAKPPSPDDFDDALHRQEIAIEYQKSRNRMIQRQGGFVGEGEDDNYGEFTAPVPVVDEETGKVRKISRFKAARVK